MLSYAYPIRFHGIRLVPIAVVAFLVVFPTLMRYLVAPFKVKRRQTREDEPRYEPVELTQLPPDVAWTFHQAAADLSVLGFRATAHLTQNLARTSQSSVASVWVNEAAGDIAQVLAVRTASPTGGVKLVTLVTFRSEFTDGTSIVTSNTASPGVFPPDPRTDSTTCPGIHDLPLLYRFHRARVARDAAGRTADARAALDGAAYMRAEHVRTFRRLVEAGYYTHNPETRRYEPTLKGAFGMTYRLLWPWKQINLSRRHRKADRLLRELGFGGIDLFRANQRPPQWQWQR